MKLYVQQSVLDELQTVGAKVAQALEFAREHCEIIDDGHCVGETAGEKLQQYISKIDLYATSKLHHTGDLATPPAAEASTPTTSHKRFYYFVATQDNDLRSALNHIPAVPLLYLNKGSLASHLHFIE